MLLISFKTYINHASTVCSFRNPSPRMYANGFNNLHFHYRGPVKRVYRRWTSVMSSVWPRAHWEEARTRNCRATKSLACFLKTYYVMREQMECIIYKLQIIKKNYVCFNGCWPLTVLCKQYWHPSSRTSAKHLYYMYKTLYPSKRP